MADPTDTPDRVRRTPVDERPTAPGPEAGGLTLNGINVALCKAFGVDDSENAGFRLTVLGGEFPALEVFRLPDIDSEGMLDAGPVRAVDQLVDRGARIAPPHLVLTEFTLAKLLEAHTAIRAAFALGQPLPPPCLTALAALEAGLSSWAEAGAPEPRVIVTTATMVDDGILDFAADMPTDVLPDGTTVDVYLVATSDGFEPLPYRDAPEAPSSREGHTGLVHDGADEFGPVPSEHAGLGDGADG